ncbi:MAG: hypothetical protein R3C12_06860 [Planctomycetaceae bacterium]
MISRLLLLVLLVSHGTGWGAEPRSLSGIYPHLAMFNNEGECGTGAVVPWADRLWVVTYAPHAPRGSSDKLYEILPDLTQIVRPESIGGTPANRMIHRESEQLFIGPYAIDAQRTVRVIPYARMFGRPTGNARHLFDPAGKIYYATMEEGVYEVDVRTLDVTELWADEQSKTGRHANLPGYHGKGLFSTQGLLLYANNGEHGSLALQRPDVPSGVLASWDGQADAWEIVRRNQFTEVTGPGGIWGNDRLDDPAWSIGWDHRSLILMCLDAGSWHVYRLPKASHSYDGAHGWNTEWPRIREIGENHLLMTMHGMFWQFPRSFTSRTSAGIRPRSTYLKVIGDFCRWNDRVVFGCDDTAKNEFLNKRKAKGEIAAPQSQSNLWFLKPEKIDRIGPVIGRGALWLQDDIVAGVPSDPFLFDGFERKGLHLASPHRSGATITLEADTRGTGNWETRRQFTLPASGYAWFDLTQEEPAVWIRLTSDTNLKEATAWFNFSNGDRREHEAAPFFTGLASSDQENFTGGIVRARGENKRTLHFVAREPGSDGPRTIGLYTLDADLTLRRDEDATALVYQQKHAAIPEQVLIADEASILFVDDHGRRWRLPRGCPNSDQPGPLGPTRICREVATERDLFNACGTFFELPAENAGGFAKVRAVATHNRRIVDYCSYRGLFVMSGVALDAPADNPHIIRSEDGRTALWAGAIDDIWQMGKPRGRGGPWKNTAVLQDEPSDPYLLTGYDRKQIVLSHTASHAVRFRIECDPTGTGLWLPYMTIDAEPERETEYRFPDAFSAAWLRVVSDTACTATVQLQYD